MNAQESIVLTRIVKAGCPAQRIDEYTIDVWAEALRDVDFGQAREAVIRLVQRQPFIAVSEIIDDVKRVHREAIRRLVDRQTFAAIEAAKHVDEDAVEQARLEARAAFDRVLAGKQTAEPSGATA